MCGQPGRQRGVATEKAVHGGSSPVRWKGPAVWPNIRQNVWPDIRQVVWPGGCGRGRQSRRYRQLCGKRTMSHREPPATTG
nr:hypothetical protein RVX_2412 [Nitratidesulfovibrio sp. HK-II]